MNTTEKKNIVDIISSGLRKSATELEQLQVQIALGKAEARDAFEDIKKDLRIHLQQLKVKIMQKKGTGDLLPVINAIEHLEVQLALGKAETKEKFESQKTKIEKALHGLESKLGPALGRQLAIWQIRQEKFKAKLKLLALGYRLQKIELQEGLEERKHKFEETLKKMRSEVSQKTATVRNSWAHFQTHIKEAFNNLTAHLLPID